MRDFAETPLELRADRRVVFVEDIIRFGDTDLNGHINNSAIATFCESGRVVFFREHIPASPDRFFVVANLNIDFRLELTYPGRVESATWLTRVGSSSLGFAQALYTGEGRVAATSVATCVAMDAASRRPQPFAGDLRDRLVGLVRIASA